jgi:hypothetical protein
LKKNIITLLKERYKLHSHRKFEKFWNPETKNQAKIEDKQKIMTHLESVHLHFTPTRKIV